jgi:hypothetical protein
MSLRQQPLPTQASTTTCALSENAVQEARDAFDRATLLAEYIHTAASELYEKAIKAQSADATDDMHFTMILEWAKGIEEALESKLNVYQLLRPAKEAMRHVECQCATRAPAVLRSPTALVRELIEAVVPTVKLHDGRVDYGAKDDRKTFEALRPLLGSYTVADAGLLLQMIYAAGGLVRDPPENDVESWAMGVVHIMLEDFLAEARASSPECVEVRARIVGMCMDDSREHPSECAMNGMRERVRWDISDLRSECFYGETFGGTSDDERYPAWLEKSAKRLERYEAGGC